MKITKEYLRRVIKEELENEGVFDNLKDKFAGTKIGQKMGMQTNKQKQKAADDSQAAAQRAKYDEYDRQQKERWKKEQHESNIKTLVEKFPKELLSLTVYQNDRNYRVTYSYIDSGKEVNKSAEYYELEARGLAGGLNTRKNIHRSNRTKMQFNVTWGTPQLWEDAWNNYQSYEKAVKEWEKEALRDGHSKEVIELAHGKATAGR